MGGTAGGQVLRLEGHQHDPRGPKAWRVVKKKESNRDKARIAGRNHIMWHLLHSMQELDCLLKTTREKQY